MKKIVLLCAGGFSTSLLMMKMEAAAKKIKYACEVAAYPVDMAPYFAEAAIEADILLLGPQVRYEKERIKKACPNVLVEVIDMIAYGTMDGEAVLLFAIGKLENSSCGGSS